MKQILILDASQISTAYECNEKYNLSYRQNLTQISDSLDEPVDAGTYGHKLLEVYYKNLNQGVNVAVAKALAIDINKLKEHFVSDLTPDMIKRVKERFGNYWMHYHDKDIRELDIIRKQKLVIESNGNGEFIDKIIQEPLIEKGFSVPLLDTPEYLFVLEGKIDMIARTLLGVSFIDNKWQFRERDLYPKSVQFKSYALATGLKTGMINYIRLKKNFDETTLQRQPISFNPMELNYWKQELIEFYIKIAKSIRVGEWSHNWDLCAGKFGYKCMFTSICEEYNPRIRESLKKVNFRKRKEWKPW